MTMSNDKQFIDFKKEVEKLKEIDGVEEYAKQLAHLFLGNGLSLQTILLMAIDFGQRHPNWIPVEERLPDEGQEVFAWNGTFKESYKCIYHDGLFEDYLGALGKGAVTHWMPIVPPIKEE